MKKTTIILIEVIVVLSIILVLVNNMTYKKKIDEINLNINENVEKEEKHYQLNMIMAGDALIHKSVYQDAKTGENTYDFKEMLSSLNPIISSYDLAFYNQETIIGGKDIGLSTYPRFNSPDEIGDAMVDLGFNMVSLANNHTMDRGEKAILYSLNYWKNKEGILTSGSYSSFNDRDNIPIMTKNNISYTLLAYTYGTNGIPVPEGKEYLVNIYSDEQVKKDIEKVRDKVDVLFVSMHWGTEYTHEPTEEQKRIATYLASLDVDVVIGHHPHVIEPIEYIEDALVIYSLGNFISAQKGISRLIGMMVSLEIHKNVNDNSTKISIDNVKSDLIYTYYNNFKNYKLYLFNELNNELLPNYDNIKAEYSSIINKYDKTIKVGIFN